MRSKLLIIISLITGTCIACADKYPASSPSEPPQSRPTLVEGYGKVIEGNDPSNFVVEVKGHQFKVSLRSLISTDELAEMPPAKVRLVREARAERFKTLILDKTVHIKNPIAMGDRWSVDLYRYAFGPSKLNDVIWKGNAPAERFAWGGYNLAAQFLQEGLSPLGHEMDGVSPADVVLLREAESLAKQQKRGIWATSSLLSTKPG